MRTPSDKTQSDRLHTVITDTLKLWRRHHLTYDQTRYVAKEVRRALAIARPPTRQRVIARLSRPKEERLIGQAYRMPGVRGLLIKTLFQTGARVSEFVYLQVADVYFDEQMLLITHAKGGKQRYVPLLPDLTHELRTYLRDRTMGPLFASTRHTQVSSRGVSSKSCRKPRRWRVSRSASIRTCCATPWRPRSWNGGCPLSESSSFSGIRSSKPRRSMRPRQRR